MRRLLSAVMIASATHVLPAAAQDVASRPAYLAWSAEEADRIGKSTRVNGRVGGAFDFRGIHTERSSNYKLRATWFTKEVIQAAARRLQISEHLTDRQTEQLVLEATASGDVVIMVEVDPREGSGVIPNDWSAFLGPIGNDQNVVRGTNAPALEKVRALHGVYRRDYDYEPFWVVFPLKTADGAALLPRGVTQAVLTVRIATKEGRVTFPIPASPLVK
jgi:hypothetical protein